MIWCPARPDAVRIDSGWNCTAHRPACAVLDRHHHAVRRSRAVTVEPAADLAGRRVQRVVAAGGELGGQPGQQRARRPPGPGRACRARARAAGTARRPRAPPSPAGPGRRRRPAGRRAYSSSSSAAQPKSAGQPGPGDSTTRSGRVARRAASGGEAEAQRDHLGALLAEVVGQRVHERVLVVDEQDPEARVARRRPATCPRSAAAGAARAAGAGLGQRLRAGRAP